MHKSLRNFVHIYIEVKHTQNMYIGIHKYNMIHNYSGGELPL